MITGLLTGAWGLAILLTLTLNRVRSAMTPGVQLRALGIGALILALGTLTSTLALACAAGVYAGLAPGALWIVVGAGAALAAWRPVGHLVRVRRLSRAADVFRRSADGMDDGVLIVDDPVPEAFAVPGRPGVVVATTGLRAALAEQEFATVIQHERAHLRHHHQLFIQSAELAACLNPLLRPWCRAVRFAAERHADECAAVPDRAVAARALAKAAVVTSGGHTAFGRLAISADAAVAVSRVRALQAPPPPRQPVLPVLAAVLAVWAIAADIVVTADWIQDRLAPEAGELLTVVLG